MDDRETALSDDEILTEPIAPSGVVEGDTDATDADSDEMDSGDQDADVDDV